MVIARINHGRWLADCVRTGCRGAELVRPGVPFICGSCYPQAFSGDPDERARWLRIAAARGEAHEVEFPAEAAQIESVLGVREPDHRNWTPGETLADLEAENAAHGLAVREV